MCTCMSTDITQTIPISYFLFIFDQTFSISKIIHIISFETILFTRRSLNPVADYFVQDSGYEFSNQWVSIFSRLLWTGHHADFPDRLHLHEAWLQHQLWNNHRYYFLSISVHLQDIGRYLIYVHWWLTLYKSYSNFFFWNFVNFTESVFHLIVILECPYRA